MIPTVVSGVSHSQQGGGGGAMSGSAQFQQHQQQQQMQHSQPGSSPASGSQQPVQAATPFSLQDHMSQVNTFRSLITIIGDSSTTTDEQKLKAAQELSENWENIVTNPQYSALLEASLRVFMKILLEGEPQFISEFNLQQLRKLLLEIIYRMPTNDALKPYVKQILSLMFRLLELENEDNVLVCLRIIIELHKQYRPQMNSEIQKFLQFVKNIYNDLPKHLTKIFEPRLPIKVKDISEIHLNLLLQETYTTTSIHIEKKPGNDANFNLIPRAMLSLKVLAELPIIVVLMYQLYKQNVHAEVSEFIPLIMSTIGLQPTHAQRSSQAFNKEVFVDFIAAQIKTLSFLAYIIKIYHDIVTKHSAQMVRGMLGLLTLCPHEVAHLRKELLIAAKHILATDQRNRFVPHMERLFDENVLVGSGWTTQESLRPLAYSMLADLVHHVRQHLPLNDLALAVNLFSKNVHDESLPSSIQTMSCKLLLNLVECIRQKAEVGDAGGSGRELLMRMLEVFVLKFKTIAKSHLPSILAKCKSNAKENGEKSGRSSSPSPDVKEAEGDTSISSSVADAVKSEGSSNSNSSQDTSKSVSIHQPLDKDVSTEEKQKQVQATQITAYSVTDCRSLVKTLVCGVKTITWGIASCKSSAGGSGDAGSGQSKQFHPKETGVFVRLVKYALQALDIYTVNLSSTTGQPTIRPAAVQCVRTKEEKEVLDHFAGVFTMMNPQTFKEVFTVTIEFMVERIYHNYALQIVANSFLANLTASASFATILVEYLLARMPEMGTNMERSNLYLKLFKLVFGSVSLFAAENEQMLKPHLHAIVNKSMELAMTAKEPFNYFLLLRALFRSIGGGSHDLLYQEFLPLLPNLLQGLNCLQSSLHKQHMKDLFVELCLTVPVRLSSLLPYLPMLMDPLVSALNGSQTLVSQGLRTLELCVDNLQPDFLYEHIQPVRAELMQALWRTLRNPNDNIAFVAFRVLGKFGGGNRKMMREPQQIAFNKWTTPEPSVLIHFQDRNVPGNSPDPIQLPVEKAVEVALAALKSSSSDPFDRNEAWNVIRCFIVSQINLDDSRSNLEQLFKHPSFHEGPIYSFSPPYECPDPHTRQVHLDALSGLFVAAAIKELRSQVLPTMASLVRHYTMVAVSQQAGLFALGAEKAASMFFMDPHVIVDALAAVMGHEEKELCKPGNLALFWMLETAVTLVGSKRRAAQLPLFEYLSQSMCALCYDRAWYAKLGGCHAIKFLYENMAPKWVLERAFSFLKALLFVMMDLTGGVSSGALDMAKSNLNQLLILIAKEPLVETGSHSVEDKNHLLEVQRKALYEVTHELVRQITSPNTTVRDEAMRSLKVLADNQSPPKTVTEVMSPHKEQLVEMVPPKKHLLRLQPVSAQIGIMEGNTFCNTLQPRLFAIDPNVNESKPHVIFVTELITLCDTDDASLMKVPCYKTVTNLIPLRKSALRALAACHYIPQHREKIFGVLYKAINLNTELQEFAFECMKNFINGCNVNFEQVHTAIRPLLQLLGDYQNLTLNVIQRLSYLTQLFPNIFNEKLCIQMMEHLKKWMEYCVTTQKTRSKSVGVELKLCAAIIDIFPLIPAASKKLIKPLAEEVLNGEKAMLMEVGSCLHEPLMNFLLKYPQQTLDLFLSEVKFKDQQWNRYLHYMLKQEAGHPLRLILQSNPTQLMNMAVGHLPGMPSSQLTPQVFNEIKFQTINIIYQLVKQDPNWLPQNPNIALNLLKIFISEAFQGRHKNIDSVDFAHWKEPKLLVKCILNFVEHHPDQLELLFHLLRAFVSRFITQFQFLKDFLETKVAKTYSVEWKRKAFFKFVDIFHDNSWPQEVKGKILQHILIPSFAHSFEQGEGEQLIGGPPSPDQDNPDNVISVFIGKVIDPDNPFGTCDAVRILLLQFSCLLVEKAAPHIHDAANKRQGTRLRRLMTFTWPCLLAKNYEDPASKYYGHLLLAHIIVKFAIHKRIVLQVFHSLLKAHAVEARQVVRQALEILTPAMPGRMEDGNTMLTHWTKKIIVEDSHTMAQLTHMLQLIVGHYKVYYPVRHHLIPHMISSMQRLGFTQNTTFEHRKLPVELCEVIIKWEIQRIKEESESSGAGTFLNAAGDVAANVDPIDSPATPGSSLGSGPDTKKARSLGGMAATAQASKPVEKIHSDAVVNFLLRIACQVNEPLAASMTSQAGEMLSRRCIALLKTALSADVWPRAELKLSWFDKLLCTAEQPGANLNNICTALDVLTFLLSILRKEQILVSFKPLQRGIAACMTSQTTLFKSNKPAAAPNAGSSGSGGASGSSSQNSSSSPKVIRALHALLSRLMSVFPTEPATSNVASKHEELEQLYACVSKVVYEGLAAYEKAGANAAAPSQLFGTLMILKAACVQNPQYIDRLITSFMKALQKMFKEHINPTATETNPTIATELLILSLELVKNRVGVMSPEMRKLFIGVILVQLMEKSTEPKVMKAIVKIVEEWVKTKNPLQMNQQPSQREKSILLVKLMHFVEQRFPDETELNRDFLELVSHVYRDPQLRETELTAKLESAFLAGLRCKIPEVRRQFFEVYEANVKRRVYDRLLYITCSQNWEPMGKNYWIKQCLELLFAVAVPDTPIVAANQANLLPACKKVIAIADSHAREDFNLMAHMVKIEPMDTSVMESDKGGPLTTPSGLSGGNSILDAAKEEEDMDIDRLAQGDDSNLLSGSSSFKKHESMDTSSTTTLTCISQSVVSDPKHQINVLIQRLSKFLEACSAVKTVDFLESLAQLCHSSVDLAQSLWISFFPRLWSHITEKQRHSLAGELVPFLCSGSHIRQKECQPSAINTFVEAIALCDPPIPIRPCVLKYVGKNHNLWHQACLMMEQISMEGFIEKESLGSGVSPYDFGGEGELTVSPNQEILDSLCELYSVLKEEDYWVGLWQKRARYSETVTALACQQQGLFEQAQIAYEGGMETARHEINFGPGSPSALAEWRMWEEQWINVSQQLNQWDYLLDYGSTLKGPYGANPQLVLESAWRVPKWTMMKDALAQVEISCPKELVWKVNLYRGFIAICHAEDPHLMTMIDKLVEVASNQSIKEWRKLPHIVSQIHIPWLQAAQQIMELQEAAQISQGLQTANIGRSSALHDMKAIVKTWRNRLPLVSDSLSHWSDIFTWRQHHYELIVNHYEAQAHDAQQQQNSMLGVHASAQAIIHFGKIARKHGLHGACLDSLSRIHTIKSVPIVDCFQKIRQQVKCYLQMAGVMGKSELQEGLDIIEVTNLKYFTKEMTAEFYALKGTFLAQIGRSEEANQAFSAAVQMHDTLVKAWALWGEYLESIFVRERSIELGVSAITCYLHACRHQNEPRSRKYLAKVLWLLSYDTEDCHLAEVVDKYVAGVPPVLWLPWIPQLLTCLIRNEGKLILNLLYQVGRMFPQAVWFPIRTLYLTLKLEQRERYKSSEFAKAMAGSVGCAPSPADVVQSPSMPEGAEPTGGQGPTVGPGPIKATPSMWRCSRIMQLQRELHPTMLASLEGILDQMLWFRENWCEEVIRQLRQALAKCYSIAFENRASVAEATITPHVANFIRKLVLSFGIGLEAGSHSISSSFSATATESLTRRAPATTQDPLFHKMKTQFTADFDFAVAGSQRLHRVIGKLKKWIKILEARIKTLPKSFLIEERCRFLSNFTSSTAEVELPGESLLPKHNYYVRIARFLPRVEIVHKYKSAARRIYLRGHNGKIYPYLVINDACMTESRREERVLQILRMLNHYLGKQKETARRLLQFHVPRVVATSPQMRLVEDNPDSVSLGDIFRRRCAKRAVDADAPVQRYYERLAALQSRGVVVSHQHLREIFEEVQSNLVPKTTLVDWAKHTFPNATDYWSFRKTLTSQLALVGLVEFVFHLTRLNPEMLHVACNSGVLNVAYFKFDIDDASGDLGSVDRPTPFRLTPNLAEFVTPNGVDGLLRGCMIAAARCLIQPNYKVSALLRAVLRDEAIAWWGTKNQEDLGATAPDMDSELLISMVNKAVNSIMGRLQGLAAFEGGESKVTTMIAAAISEDNLCRADPTWHPWL